MGGNEITKAGWLPNVSSNFEYYRQLAINQMEKKQYASASSSLSNLNGCLGEEYLVTISTAQHDQAIVDRSVYQCSHCTMPFKKTVNKGEENEHIKEIQIPTEIPLSEVRVFDLRVPLVESILRGNTSIKIWVCPECDKENTMDETRKIVPQIVNPYFLKIVRDCPLRLMGISNRLGFHEKFQNWFSNFLEEINWQEVLYRKEYRNQHGFEMEESDFKDKGDQK